MQRKDIDPALTRRAFDFFYWFSRFEFALKERGYLTSKRAGVRAEADWKGFVAAYENLYSASPEAEWLLASPPEVQVVGRAGTLTWCLEETRSKESELAVIVRLLKTVRNNLFHGGKHGPAGWDDPKRTLALISASMLLLDQLAEMASLWDDYARTY
jgi:hypothetical protein